MKKTLILSVLASVSLMASVNMTNAAATAGQGIGKALLKGAYEKGTKNDMKIAQQFVNVLQNTIHVPVRVKKTMEYRNGKDNIVIVEYEAQTRRGEVPFKGYIMKDKPNYLFAIGKAFTKDGKQIDMPKDAKIINEGVAFTVGHGPQVIYLVTDPECPFCQRLEKMGGMSDKVKEKYTIKVIPMPLSFHRHSRAMLYYILDAKTNKDKAKRMKEVMKDGSNVWQNYKISDKRKAEIDEQIKKSLNAAKELKARGTPSIFDSNFNPLNYQILLQK